jgi:N-terminal acetyltransferase 2
LKKLSREYGWSALGVYALLSVIDFPICYLAVRTVGAERVAHWEHVVIEGFWKVVRIPFPNLGKPAEPEEVTVLREAEIKEAAAREGALGRGQEGEKAGAKNNGDNASKGQLSILTKSKELLTRDSTLLDIWTMLALAYAVHKSLIFFRVPLTAAVTPKVVKTLRGWGWDIGKRRPKASGGR